MNQQKQSLDNQFTALTDFTSSETVQIRPEGNVLHNVDVNPLAFAEFQVKYKHQESDEMEVIVNRDAEKITSIEIQCSCGNSKIINFEYDEE